VVKVGIDDIEPQQANQRQRLAGVDTGAVDDGVEFPLGS